MIKLPREFILTTLIFVSYFFYSLLCGSIAAQNRYAFKHVSIGDTIPYFELKTLNHKVVSSDSIKGKVAVLIFWKPGQKQSLEALKELKSIYTELKGKGVQVLAITSSNESQVQECLVKMPLPFLILIDHARKVYGGYGVIVTPTTAIIDTAGKLRYYFPGYAFNYEVAIEGNLKFMLGMISKTGLDAIVNPKEIKEGEEVTRAKRHIELANVFSKKNMIDEARREYEQAIRLAPALASAHIGLGFLLLKDKNFDEALIEFDKALEESPNSHDAKIGKAIVFARKGDLARSQEILKQALVLNPNAARVHYELGKIYEQKNQMKKAILEYKAALAEVFKDTE